MLRPATKFIKSSPGKQLLHVLSEAYEVILEFILWKLTGDSHRCYLMARELVDLQMSCETLLAILGYRDTDRKWLREATIRSNRKRGYYEEAR